MRSLRRRSSSSMSDRLVSLRKIWYAQKELFDSYYCILPHQFV
ncbi:hypothetical protein M6B38_286120 [Iris pallida]|uniref:Uncharacterized protein n=1 Tax=Iris pallida TaxID=29817 RepID=A0AAX6HXW8_IRIPA|nr:hypothetical protein M6B38_286120 [Iris pallida]